MIPGQTFVTEDPDKGELSSHIGRGPRPRLELADIQSCRLRSLSDWCFSERHDADVFSQVGASGPLTRRHPALLSWISVCRSSSRCGTGSAAWTCSQDISTTSSTCSVTTQRVPTAAASNPGTWAFTPTSGSGQCGRAERLSAAPASRVRL